MLLAGVGVLKQDDVVGVCEQDPVDKGNRERVSDSVLHLTLGTEVCHGSFEVDLKPASPKDATSWDWGIGWRGSFLRCHMAPGGRSGVEGVNTSAPGAGSRRTHAGVLLCAYF